MSTIECYIDVVISENSHRITIKHNDMPCDAEIFVDEKKVEPRSKILPDGGCLMFDIDGHKTVIVIINNGGSFDYDCFIDDVSVQSGMPWTLGKLQLPAVLKWRKTRPAVKWKYVLSEALKGAIVGCGIFFVLFVLQYFVAALENKVGYIYLLISIALPAILFAIMAPDEYKKSEAALAEYKRYTEAEVPADNADVSTASGEGSEK